MIKKHDSYNSSPSLPLLLHGTTSTVVKYLQICMANGWRVAVHGGFVVVVVVVVVVTHESSVCGYVNDINRSQQQQSTPTARHCSLRTQLCSSSSLA